MNSCLNIMNLCVYVNLEIETWTLLVLMMPDFSYYNGSAFQMSKIHYN